jgi:(heptosyl)LPS beta-1,4-glucosyltransferase
MSISVAINTLNEEKNLPLALRSVRPWVDEIVLVDMHSTDRTVEIAESFGARVYQHEPLGFADPARAFAVSQTKGDWVLILDADEIIPVRLAERLQAISKQSDCDVVRIPRLNYFMGSPARHAGLAPDYQARFFRRDALITTETIHDFLKPVPGARVIQLPVEDELSIAHFTFLDVAHFVDRLNRYTTIESRQAAARGEQTSPLSASLRAAREFLRRYVSAGGYRDGWRGFHVSALYAFYTLSAAAKLAELNGGVSAEGSRRFYERTAERLLDEYNDRSAADSTPGNKRRL